MMVKRWLTRLLQGVEALAAVLLLLTIALNFTNVVGRYGFGWTLVWAEDIQVFVLVWMVFLGAALASCRNTHVRMDLVLRALPPRVRRLVAVLEGLVTCVLFGFVAWLSHDYVRRIIELDPKSPIAQLPMWIPHAAVASSFGSMALMALARAVASCLRLMRGLPRQGQPA